MEIVGDAEQEPDPMDVLRLAVSRAISAYDAQFVVLARTLRTILITADRRLVRQCPDEAIHVSHFIAD